MLQLTHGKVVKGIKPQPLGLFRVINCFQSGSQALDQGMLSYEFGHSHDGETQADTAKGINTFASPLGPNLRWGQSVCGRLEVFLLLHADF